MWPTGDIWSEHEIPMSFLTCYSLLPHLKQPFRGGGANDIIVLPTTASVCTSPPIFLPAQHPGDDRPSANVASQTSTWTYEIFLLLLLLLSLFFCQSNYPSYAASYDLGWWVIAMAEIGLERFRFELPPNILWESLTKPITSCRTCDHLRL